MVVTDFGSSLDRIQGLALQADGKIVAVGETASGGGRNFALARYLPNGKLDDRFGDDGKVVTRVAGGDAVAKDVVIQADGRIVAVGSTTNGPSETDFALVRYQGGVSRDRPPLRPVSTRRASSPSPARTRAALSGRSMTAPGRSRSSLASTAIPSSALSRASRRSWPT